MDALAAAFKVKSMMVEMFSAECDDAAAARDWYERNIEVWDAERLRTHAPQSCCYPSASDHLPRRLARLGTRPQLLGRRHLYGSGRARRHPRLVHGVRSVLAGVVLPTGKTGRYRDCVARQLIVTNRCSLRSGAVRDIEERFTGLKMTAACVQLNREQIRELIAITAELVKERKRIRRLLERLPENFGEVRKVLNELSRAVR